MRHNRLLYGLVSILVAAAWTSMLCPPAFGQMSSGMTAASGGMGGGTSSGSSASIGAVSAVSLSGNVRSHTPGTFVGSDTTNLPSVYGGDNPNASTTATATLGGNGTGATPAGTNMSRTTGSGGSASSFGGLGTSSGTGISGSSSYGGLSSGSSSSSYGGLGGSSTGRTGSTLGGSSTTGRTGTMGGGYGSTYGANSSQLQTVPFSLNLGDFTSPVREMTNQNLSAALSRPGRIQGLTSLAVSVRPQSDTARQLTAILRGMVASVHDRDLASDWS